MKPPEPDPIPLETLRLLHRGTLDNSSAIRRLLNRARRAKAEFGAGISRTSNRRTARIVACGKSHLELDATEIEAHTGRQLAMNFTLEGERYFFVTQVLRTTNSGTLLVEFPKALHLRENRELVRAAPSTVPTAPTSVEISSAEGSSIVGTVIDWTYHGMAIKAASPKAKTLHGWVQLRSLGGPQIQRETYASVRHRASLSPGWTRLGLSVTQVKPQPMLSIERYEHIDSLLSQSESTRSTSEPTSRRIVFQNDRGELLSGVIDKWGESKAPTGVVICPAWGRTKETLLPVAATLVESFRSADKPIVVLRFDGTRRRGESYVPQGCVGSGREHLQFTFSQAVQDTRSAVKLLRDPNPFGCRRVVLVTFSLAAIEARRVLALDGGMDLAGWVSVVGIADLQSALHTISGGVDYGSGLLRGLRFGRQELFGVMVDIDLSGHDAIARGLAFLEDARRDMTRIDVPITWLHGKFDGWVDPIRVRELLSCGNSTRRRLVELPIGHQLRSSVEAIETFRFVSEEVARMALGEAIPTTAPDPEHLLVRWSAERRRAVRSGGSLRPFWREYLLGRRGNMGIEVLTATDAYRTFMQKQVTLLGLRAGQRVADLGAGAGDFIVQLLRDPAAPRKLAVDAVDFVQEALVRGRERLAAAAEDHQVEANQIVSDLDAANQKLGIPVASARYDAALASLLLSYVTHPRQLLEEIRRILRPGGILVLSTLRRDADISKLYADSLTERYSSRPTEVFGAAGAHAVDRSLPHFLNYASRIIELEDQGRFRFFDADELAALTRAAGFEEVSHLRSLGDPPQAVIVRARRFSA